MKKKEDFKATVDGDEVEVEVVENQGRQYSSRQTSERVTVNGVPFTKWQLIKPFIGPIAFFVVVGVLALTVFVWMLPVLIPLAVVFFIYKILTSK